MTRPFHTPPLQAGRPARAPAFRVNAPLSPPSSTAGGRAYPLAPGRVLQRLTPVRVVFEPAQDERRQNASVAWCGVCGTG